MRNDPIAPKRDETAIERAPLRTVLARVRLACIKGLGGVGVEQPRLATGVDVGEFARTPFPDRLGKLLVVIGEIQERGAATELLAHEKQRNLRVKQQQRDGDANRSRVGQCQEAVAEQAIADLVVVLQAVDETGRRQVRAGPAARLAAEGGDLALEREAFRHHSREMADRVVGKAAVIGRGLARQHDVDGMVKIIVPLRVEPRQQAGIVGVVLYH